MSSTSVGTEGGGAVAHGPTELIHLTYEGNFLLRCEAIVLECRILTAPEENGEGRDVEIILDRTVLHPQGGGQPADSGTVSSPDRAVKIERVSLDRDTGVVIHVGRVSLGDGESPPFRVGGTVTVEVDADRRQLHSECHTAGHVIDRAMERIGKALPPTKGYHFIDGPYVEYRGTIPPDDRADFLSSLQSTFHDLVDEDIPTTIQTLPRNEAEELCCRLAENFDFASMVGEDVKDVRVVTAAGWSCPCGGTHVKGTGELKQRGWAVKGIRCKKGVVRVRYGPTVGQSTN